MGNNFVIDPLLTDKLTQVSEDMVWLQQSSFCQEVLDKFLPAVPINK